MPQTFVAIFVFGSVPVIYCCCYCSVIISEMHLAYTHRTNRRCIYVRKWVRHAFLSAKEILIMK